MLWLASFPRSGNTFFRNVLHEVYGIPSSGYHLDPDRVLDEHYASYSVIKTHLLPGQLPEGTQDWPSVYIVRDGRDSMVSIAHHRKDIVVPGSDFYNNLLEAILAQNGSFFGGWSENVRQWTAKADVVIRFEDLIADPIREVEKLRAVIDLPEPKREALPTFQSLKMGRPAYGGGKGGQFDAERNRMHFRRGKVGAWKEEVTPELRRLLMRIHGPMLRHLGYAPAAVPPVPTAKTVLLEASKLFTNDNDGIKRYLAGLDFGINILSPHFPHLKVALYYGNGVLVNESKAERADPEFRRLSEREAILQDRRTMGYEKALLLIKSSAKRILHPSIYQPVARVYHRGFFRKFLSDLKLRVRKLAGRLSSADLQQLVDSADLIHLPLPQHFGELPVGNASLLVTVHDLTHRLFPNFHDEANIRFSEEGLQASLAQDAHFLCVSQATAQDLGKLYGVPPAKRSVIYEAADDNKFNRAAGNTDLARLRKRYGIPNGPYLFCLSTIEPRKNLRTTILAFEQLKFEHPELAVNLVIGGKRGWKTEQIFAGLDLDRPDIVLTGFVEDEHLPALYAQARAFCYLSHYEGFGLPLAEALACGTPVIYGNNSSQPEVAGRAGLAVPSDNIKAVCDAMRQLVTDDELHQKLSEEAWMQSNRFSWLKTVLLTLDLYERLLYPEDICA